MSTLKKNSLKKNWSNNNYSCVGKSSNITSRMPETSNRSETVVFTFLTLFSVGLFLIVFLNTFSMLSKPEADLSWLLIFFMTNVFGKFQLVSTTQS